MEQFKDILENLGYKLRDRGKEWSMRPLYRASDNDTALCVRKRDGVWIDFVSRDGGPFEKLVKLTVGLPTLDSAKAWLKSNKFEISTYQPELNVEYDENLSLEDLKDLVPSYEYWEKRGISKETLDVFQGGVVQKNVSSSLYNRYVFPIFDSHKNCIGMTGRWLGEEGKAAKWKHAGSVNRWCHPAIFNKKEILKSRKIVLVESMGDFLKLWEAGVKYGLILFSTNLGKAMLKAIIAANPEEIIVSTNNDMNNKFVGNKAAKTIQSQLTNFFDPEQVKIVLPELNDWGVTDVKDIQTIFSA